jgi:hypothetical protein
MWRRILRLGEFVGNVDEAVFHMLDIETIGFGGVALQARKLAVQSRLPAVLS